MRANSPGIRRQHHDSRGQKDSFRHRVRHKDPGPILFRAQPQQFLIQPVARHLIQSARTAHPSTAIADSSPEPARSRHASSSRPKVRVDTPSRRPQVPPVPAAPPIFLRAGLCPRLPIPARVPRSAAPSATAAALRPEKYRTRFRVRSSGVMPSTRMLPALGAVSPEINFSTVDLPHPDGPMRVTNSPFRIFRSIACNTACALP